MPVVFNMVELWFRVYALAFEAAVHQWTHCVCSNVLEVDSVCTDTSTHTDALILLFYPWFTLATHTLAFACHSSSSGGFVFIAFYMFFTELTSPESAQFFFLSPVVCVLSCPLCIHKHIHVIRAMAGVRFCMYILFSVLVICFGLDAKYEL